MKTVWLLINEMDYEWTSVHTIFAQKPSIEALAQIITDVFQYEHTNEIALTKAQEILETESARFLSNYTLTLEERAVV